MIRRIRLPTDPPLLAARAAIALTVLLTTVELLRIVIGAPLERSLIACAAVAIYLPLHIWHLRYGLRGRRPPRALVTLAVMVAVNLAAALLVGAGWALHFAALATSGLIVLRPRWAFALLAACVGGAVALRAAHHGGTTELTSFPARYLGFSVLFRSVLQFVVVWLVAVVNELSEAREALADEALRDTRARLETDVRRSLDDGLHAMLDAAIVAGARHERGDAEGARAQLRVLLEQARETLARMRGALRAARPAAGSVSAATALADAVRSTESPVGRAVHSPQRSRRMLIASHACVLGFPMLSVSGLLGLPVTDPGVTLPILVVLAALQILVSVTTMRGERLRYPAVAVLAVAALSAGLIPAFGLPWEVTVWVLAATTAMIGPARWVLPVLVAVATGAATYEVVSYIDYGGTTGPVLWDGLYTMTIFIAAPGCLYAATQLVRMADELSETRFALAVQTIEEERGRVSGELHDVLGQSLAAISLKGDLALRLIGRDDAGAARELGELRGLAQGQLSELEAIAQGERRTSFATEAPEAAALLRAAGMDVHVDVRLPEVSGEADALLGWAVREGATNVLRHSRARRCSIRASADGGRVTLELVNDGAVPATATAPGSGLTSLAERFAVASGVVRGAHDGERFLLRVELPA